MYGNLVPCEKYNNFYHVPKYEFMVISKDGAVIDTITGKLLNEIISSEGYPSVHTKGKTHSVHRLIAETFLPSPDKDISKLDVNHIDGVKANYRIDNLEWTTRQENCLHAYKTGLRDDNTPILVKDLRDDSVVRYYSLQECARQLDVPAITVFNHLKPQNRGKISWNHFVLIYEDDDWPVVDKDQMGKHRNGDPKMVLCQSEDGSTIVFESLGTAAEYFDIKPKTLQMHVQRYKDKPYHGKVFRFIDDLSVVTENEIIRKDRTQKRHKRQAFHVRVTNTIDGTVQDWSSSEEFAISQGTSKNTLQKAIWRTKGMWKHFKVEYLDLIVINESPAHQ